MRVEVTQEHIDRSRKLLVGEDACISRSDMCPLALALRDNGYPEASVFVIDWSPRLTSTRFPKLSADAIRFRDDFDLGKPVSPAVFEFEDVKP